MKNFLAGLAIVVLLIVFPLQSVLEISNERRIQRFSDIVYVAAQTARLDGYFKQTTIDKLKSDLMKEFPDLSDGDIYVNVTTTMKYRTNEFDEREAINYDIRIPIRKIVAVPAYWGISENENRTTAKRAGFVLSEVLAP
ncbi:hypothetical protein [Ruminiclostridium cellulolyticum]|uniref:Uncharacterized protein n=1 Tax=Ruminiclostridium cellulolyticum (strain ATCC 35319 / DSM 5812 / JCM 6584 / H10) TaxID=394503 RepID=B8I099_RUMCH|nr:hypothetical protein [Ruminiclostridium cellulolyticum]ACL77425.1 hypothetical protein Ccel_3134 [Ruminiclostridium cellulolyticum H10]